MQSWSLRPTLVAEFVRKKVSKLAEMWIERGIGTRSGLDSCEDTDLDRWRNTDPDLDGDTDRDPSSASAKYSEKDIEKARLKVLSLFLKRLGEK